MSTVTLANALLVFSLLTCLLAFVRGGTPERIGAAIILANIVATAANGMFLKDQRVLLAIDGATAIAFLPLVLRYASVWLGGVMLLYGVQFGLHAFYFVLERPKDLLHVTINNANFFAISLCLAAGTVISWRRRRKAEIVS
jgi:hypothetical protein